MRLMITGIVLLFLLGSIGSSQNNYLTQSPSGGPNGNVSDWLGFPWYSSNPSLFSYEFNATPEMSQAFSFFNEYYISSGLPIVGGIVSIPVQFDIAQKTPSRVYFASGRPVPYSQYVSATLPRGNELWVQGATDWSQYVISPVGTWLQLVAYTPAGGPASVYEIVQTGSTTVSYRPYQLYPGYNSMNFYADQAGRHILLFVLNNQPSNAVIIDVAYQAPPSTEYVPPQSASVSPPQYTSPPAPLPTPSPYSGDTPVTIRYPDPRSFQVYVDGTYAGAGAGGSFSFRVKGGMSHEINVWDGSWEYQKNVYFESGVPKIIYVEAV